MMLASTEDERAQLASLYDADPERIEIVPPGVDHSVFAPGDSDAARAKLELRGQRVLLCAGRIQPLKDLGLAIESLAALGDPDVTLLIVGGPSGHDGEGELARIRALVGDLGVCHQVRFVPPLPHAELADYYRAADVCIVPSRTESFGLVALEAAACGTPVVAASVGGLRSLVQNGQTGYLVDGRDPIDFATPVAMLLEDREFATEMGLNAAANSRRYSWSITAARLRRLYGDLVARGLVRCE
jgi:D-inositol-3-phosphate glycosyltransferase